MTTTTYRTIRTTHVARQDEPALQPKRGRRRPPKLPEADIHEAVLANFEIISWDDPILRDTPKDQQRVLVDGLLPLHLAEMIKALCDQYNTALA